MGWASITCRPMMDAAVVVLLDQKPCRNKVYNLTSPRPTKDSNVAELLSQKCDTLIEHWVMVVMTRKFTNAGCLVGKCVMRPVWMHEGTWTG